ncbi:hypothetical protein SLEP1_g33694 [Rubroshorea leprosula]|uniref:Reverse transcriptase Ty1/copia-type domain-containing protein n=1 Tax=Rubroshorea leprosula TaxID=152421 RepID=A0AAV5KHF1_9ROSI|nr:hypothetical protein SLEP1_g33694 [Rubroshorea leprosula]
MVRSLLFQAKLPSEFWVEALYVAAHLINVLPCSRLQLSTPHEPNPPPPTNPVHPLNPPTPSSLLGQPNSTCPTSTLHSPTSLPPTLNPSPDLHSLSSPVHPPAFINSPSATVASTHVASLPPASNPSESTCPCPDSVFEQEHEVSTTPLLSAALPPSGVVSRRLHGMVARSQVGVRKPKILPSMVHTLLDLTEPKTFKQVQWFPEWQHAMNEEYVALLHNKTWVLVPPPCGANIVGSKWPGIDYDETFSPVVKSVTICTVLALALSKSWPIHQLDVKNAFLNGSLSEPVYMSQPPGFVDPQYPNHVCFLQRALYGLKQALRAWFQRFAAFLYSCGFIQAYSDCSMFLYHSNGMLAILLLYVDDIILTASTQPLLDHIIALLEKEFLMTDLGVLNYFLGITARFNSDGIFLCQTKYVADLLDCTGMSDCKAVSTPMTPKQKLVASDSPPCSDSTQYRSIVGALQYLTFTRPDIAFAVQQVRQYMHAPIENHFQAVKRILCYLQGTLHYGLQLFKDFSPSLHIYADADWVGCLDSRRFTSGYCLFFGRSLVSWSSKKQPIVARSSAEAEYRAMANAVAEVVWVR